MSPNEAESPVKERALNELGFPCGHRLDFAQLGAIGGRAVAAVTLTGNISKEVEVQPQDDVD